MLYCLAAKVNFRTFLQSRDCSKIIENGEGVALCIDTFFPFQQIFLPLRFFCFVSRFLYLFCPLAIYTSNIPLLQKTLLLALSNCLEVASSNFTNNVLDVVQEADQNGCWNIRLLIATLTVLGISKVV